MKSIRLLLVGIVLLVCESTLATHGQSRPMGILPQQIAWKPNTAVPPGASVATLIGNPTERARYVLRLRFPAGHRVMPHSHPEERVYTVVEGTWRIGIGAEVDESKVDGFPVGSVYLLPPGTPHFHPPAMGETIVQVTGFGPTATVYANPVDDPRKR